MLACRLPLRCHWSALAHSAPHSNRRRYRSIGSNVELVKCTLDYLRVYRLRSPSSWSTPLPLGAKHPKSGFTKPVSHLFVCFVTDRPDLSYGPYPPGRTAFAVFAITFAALGITVIFLAYRS